MSRTWDILDVILSSWSLAELLKLILAMYSCSRSHNVSCFGRFRHILESIRELCEMFRIPEAGSEAETKCLSDLIG